MLEQIKELLQSNSIEFRELHHEPTQTSQESADIRGEDLSTGGKALVLKIDDSFKLLVLSAARKLNSSAVKKYFGAKKVRFADKEELMELTGLLPGAVPPFGEPILPLELFVDTSIAENEIIAFNAGSHTDSIIMSAADYLKIANPTIFTFSK